VFGPLSFTYVLPDTSLTGPYAWWGLPGRLGPAQFGRGRAAINIIDTEEADAHIHHTGLGAKLNVVIRSWYRGLQDNVGVKASRSRREVPRGNRVLERPIPSRAMQP